jgi:hypothetical protein
MAYLTTEPMICIVTLADNAPITGATVVLTVTLPGQPVALTLPLYDDGRHGDGARLATVSMRQRSSARSLPAQQPSVLLHQAGAALANRLLVRANCRPMLRQILTRIRSCTLPLVVR